MLLVSSCSKKDRTTPDYPVNLKSAGDTTGGGGILPGDTTGGGWVLPGDTTGGGVLPGDTTGGGVLPGDTTGSGGILPGDTTLNDTTGLFRRFSRS